MITSIFFARHAQPLRHADDRTRPLSPLGHEDALKVRDLLVTLGVDHYYSSPYVRAMDTVGPAARAAGKTIRTDERFRERENGPAGAEEGMHQRRWEDFSFCEENGECLQSVQDRYVEALLEILRAHPGQKIAIGTHGAALSALFNYFDPRFDYDFACRISPMLPYVVRVDFRGEEYVGHEELLVLERGYLPRPTED